MRKNECSYEKKNEGISVYVVFKFVIFQLQGNLKRNDSLSVGTFYMYCLDTF